MAYDIVLSSQAKKYVKKIKDQKLKQKFVDVIYDDTALDSYSFD